jgi:ABC-type transport system involved in multi-copper enzyme maturation permease subunit
MRDALAYELVRIRTIRSTWWITALAVVAGVGISTLFSWAVSHDFRESGTAGAGDDLPALPAMVVTQLAATGELPSIVCYLLAMIGIFAWGHEYRHGMVRASLTALNSRSALWAAKLVVVAVWTAVVAFVTLALAGLVGSLFLSEWLDVLTVDTWEVIGRQVGFGVILAALAMAVTSVTRSQAFALVLLFLWPLLVESLIRLFFVLVPALRDDQDILRFLPFGAGNQMVNAFSQPTTTFGDPLSALGGTIVFGGTAIVLLVASFITFRSRDA